MGGIRNEPTPRRRQNQNGCPVLQTPDEEIAECYTERPVVRVNCTSQVSPENTVAEIRFLV